MSLCEKNIVRRGFRAVRPLFLAHGTTPRGGVGKYNCDCMVILPPVPRGSNPLRFGRCGDPPGRKKRAAGAMGHRAGGGNVSARVRGGEAEEGLLVFLGGEDGDAGRGPESLLPVPGDQREARADRHGHVRCIRPPATAGRRPGGPSPAPDAGPPSPGAGPGTAAVPPAPGGPIPARRCDGQWPRPPPPAAQGARLQDNRSPLSYDGSSGHSVVQP